MCTVSTILVVCPHRNYRDLQRTEMCNVMCNSRDILVAGEKPVAASPISVRDGAARTKIVPDAEWVSNVAGVEYVEVTRPIADGRSSCHGSPLGVLGQR